MLEVHLVVQISLWCSILGTLPPQPNPAREAGLLAQPAPNRCNPPQVTGYRSLKPESEDMSSAPPSTQKKFFAPEYPDGS
jgi:hypothetical protein